MNLHEPELFVMEKRTVPAWRIAQRQPDTTFVYASEDRPLFGPSGRKCRNVGRIQKSDS